MSVSGGGALHSRDKIYVMHVLDLHKIISFDKIIFIVASIFIVYYYLI